MNKHNASSSESLQEQRDRLLFESIADAYAQKDLAPSARCARAQRLLQTMRRIPSSKKRALLEVGCGAGYAARYLEGQYQSYEGVDYSETLIAYAMARNGVPGASFRVLNVKQLEPRNKYDVILLIGVLHHLDEPVSVLGKLKTHLLPGGWLVANEPHRGNRLISSLRYARKKLDANYSDEQNEYDSAELLELFEATGYQDVEIFPQGFFSTPFAEVVFPLPKVTGVLSRLACSVDRYLERAQWPLLQSMSWNLVVQGRAAG